MAIEGVGCRAGKGGGGGQIFEKKERKERTSEVTVRPEIMNYSVLFFFNNIFGGRVVGLRWSGRAAAGAFVGRSRYFLVPRTHHTIAEKPV